MPELKRYNSGHYAGLVALDAKEIEYLLKAIRRSTIEDIWDSGLTCSQIEALEADLTDRTLKMRLK